MDYYKEIKQELINNEINRKVKEYSINKSDLNTYYNVGKMLIEAQGGEHRAKYGDGLIKEYSKRLMVELGSKYNETLLKRIRKFYLLIEKGAPMGHQLNWSHYRELIPLNDINKINYYIDQIIKRNLTKRQLQEIIRSKEYERLPESTKNKLLNKEDISIEDNIKNEYIIKYSSDKRILVREYEFI